VRLHIVHGCLEELGIETQRRGTPGIKNALFIKMRTMTKGLHGLRDIKQGKAGRYTANVEFSGRLENNNDKAPELDPLRLQRFVMSKRELK
jgi:hypothetical protein